MSRRQVLLSLQDERVAWPWATRLCEWSVEMFRLTGLGRWWSPMDQAHQALTHGCPPSTTTPSSGVPACRVKV